MSEEKILVFQASGRYSRSITVYKDKLKCYECEKERICLSFDSSDDEYSSINFCKGCLNKFFEGYISKSEWNRKLND